MPFQREPLLPESWPRFESTPSCYRHLRLLSRQEVLPRTGLRISILQLRFIHESLAHFCNRHTHASLEHLEWTFGSSKRKIWPTSHWTHGENQSWAKSMASEAVDEPMSTLRWEHHREPQKLPSFVRHDFREADSQYLLMNFLFLARYASSCYWLLSKDSNQLGFRSKQSDWLSRKGDPKCRRGRKNWRTFSRSWVIKCLPDEISAI